MTHNKMNRSAEFESELNNPTIGRRRILQGLMAGAGVAAVGLPQLTSPALGESLGSGDKILVTLRLKGGNDGLNTLIPVNNNYYRDLRRDLAIPTAGTHPVGNGLNLHPSLSRTKARFDRGDVAIVRGVGDPTLDHSHFSCIKKWMTARDSGISRDGWLGRYLDGRGSSVYGGISIGAATLPEHMKRRNGDTVNLPVFPELFGAANGRPWDVPMHQALSGLANAAGHNKWTDLINDSQKTAIGAAQRMLPVYNPQIPDPALGTEVVRDLELAARVINMNVGARVVAVELGDFDTHDDQLANHASLLSAMDAGIEKFFASLRSDLRDRVVLMTYSEFGRRPQANGSRGVDHGTSSCLFVMGNRVTGGLYGTQPGLAPDRLDTRGDMKVHVDYRSVYATVLEDHLGADANQILGRSYENLGFFRSANQPPEPTPTTVAPVPTTAKPTPTTAKPTPTTAPPTPTTAPPKPVAPARPGPQKFYCNGKEATIVGTKGHDRITGTPGRDVIVGGPGNDFIDGKGGNDLICGGHGNDRIHGGPGRDTIFGGGGRDVLAGQSGRDRVHGGPGLDKLIRQAIDFFNRQ